MADLVLTLEQGVQQVLTDSTGASMIDEEACVPKQTSECLAQPLREAGQLSEP